MQCDASALGLQTPSASFLSHSSVKALQPWGTAGSDLVCIQKRPLGVQLCGLKQGQWEQARLPGGCSMGPECSLKAAKSRAGGGSAEPLPPFLGAVVGCVLFNQSCSSTVYYPPAHPAPF